MGRIYRDSTADGNDIRIEGAPDMTADQKKAFNDRLEAAIGSFRGSFEDAGRAIQQAEGQRVSPNVDRAQSALQSTMTPQQESVIDTQATSEEPKANFKGYIDAITRELGPLMAAGAAGALAGSVIPGAGTAAGGALGMAAYGITDVATPIISKFLNDKFGTNQVSAREGWSAIFDSIGIEEPDTKAEQIVAAGARGVADAVSFLQGGKLLQTGAPTLGEATMAQTAGKIISQAPAQQIVGEGMSGIGAEGGSQIAEGADMGPVMSMILTMGGAVAGDMTGAGLAALGENALRLMKSKNIPMEAAVREALDTADNAGVPIYRSDFTPIDKPGEELRTIRETAKRGLGDIRYSQQAPSRRTATQELISSFTDDMPVVESEKYSSYLKESAEEFIADRKVDWDASKAKKGDVIKAHGSEQVPMTNVQKYLKDAGADLEFLDDPDGKALEKQLAKWEARYSDADADTSLGTIERLRKNIGNLFKDNPDGKPTDEQQGVINGMYAAINKDMGDFLKQADPSGMDYAKWRDGNAELKALMDDFEIKGIEDILDGRNKKVTGDVLGDILYSAPIQKLEGVMARLPSGSQAKARDAFNAKMIRDATVMDELSYSKFMSNLDNNKDRYDIIFGKDSGSLSKVFGTLDPDLQKNLRGSFMAEQAEKATTNGVLSPNKLFSLLDENKAVTKVMFDDGDMGYINGLGTLIKSTSRAEADKLAKDMFPGEELPGGSYMLSRAISKNPVVGISLMMGSRVGRGKAIIAMESNKELRDALIKYDQIPQENKEMLAQVSKRIGEIFNTYLNASEKESTDNRSSGNMR